MESSEDFIFAVDSLATIVHIAPDLKNLLDPFRGQVLAFLNQSRDSNEFRKISLFLCGEKMEPFEERYDIRLYGVEVVDFEVPNTVGSSPQCPAFQMLLEQSQNDFVFL